MSATTTRPMGAPSGVIPFAMAIGGLLVVLVAERILAGGDWHRPVGWLGGLMVLAATVARGVAWRRAVGRVRQAERLLFIGSAALTGSLLLFDLQAAPGLAALGLEPNADAAVVLKVLWLVVMLTALAAVVAMERAWMAMPLAESVEVGRLRSAGLGAASVALGLVFVFGVNYAATRKDVRKDVTFFKTTRPSGTTESYVRQLEEPVVALLFFAPVSDVLPQVKPYFDALVGTNFSVLVKDYALEPELARRYRVRDNGFVVLVRADEAKALGVDAGGDAGKGGKGGKGGKAAKIPASERFEIGDELEPARRNLRKLDATFQKRFTKLTQAPKRVRFTTGHKERSKRGEPTDQRGQRIETVHALLERFNIGSDGLGLGDGLAKDVPKGSSAVVVVGPRQRFLDEEIGALERYVRGGGRLMLLVDPQGAGSREGDDGLDPLLERLGVKRLPGTVASVGHHMRSTFTKADRALVYTNTFSSHPSVSSASRNSLRVAAVVARGVAFDRMSPAPKGLRVTFPIRSAADSWRDLDGDLERGKAEPRKKLNLMATVTVPNKAGGPEGRVVVIGDGDFVSDGLMKAGGNALIFVDSLRWLIGEDKIRGDLASEEDVPIEHRKDEDRVWFYATTFAVPLPLLLIGLWVGRRRRGGGR